MTTSRMVDLEKKRELKGLAIVTLGSCVKRINKLHYRVKSQSDNEKCYDLVKRYGHNIGGHQEGEWTCTCPDFTYRHIVCKHVYAVGLSKELRKKIVSQDVVPPITLPVQHFNNCERCKSERLSY